jgi:hypothetical protein
MRLSRRVVLAQGAREPGAADSCAGGLLVSPLDAKRRRNTEMTAS